MNTGKCLLIESNEYKSWGKSEKLKDYSDQKSDRFEQNIDSFKKEENFNEILSDQNLISSNIHTFRQAIKPLRKSSDEIDQISIPLKSIEKGNILQPTLPQVKARDIFGQKVSTEKNLKNNITRLMKFVKLKKKIKEIKKKVFHSQISKNLLMQTGSTYFQVLNNTNSFEISDSPSQKQEQLTRYRLIRFLSRAFQNIPAIEPSSKFKLIWDLLLSITIMIFFFLIPVHVAFDMQIHQLIIPQLGFTLNAIMGLDLIFSMNTGYFDKGISVTNKAHILRYYLTYYFWGDIISQIPLLVSELSEMDSLFEKIFILCFFVKLRNVLKIFKKLQESFHLSPRSNNIISLIKLILTILFFSHIFSCVWIFVGRNQPSSTTTWLNKMDMQDEDWLQQYIMAYYFSTVTMITVGFGDITPQNNLERLVCIGTMLISCVIFAYTINQIGTIFEDIFSQDRQLKEFFYIINDYMDTKSIGFSLQYKIREYLDYYWREQDQNKSDLERKIIDTLSDQLRENLMVEANRIVLKDSAIFNNHFNQAVILKMIPIIQTMHIMPNQIIFSENQVDDDMFIYFVEKGKVQVCREQILPNSTKLFKPIQVLGPGSCFGAWSFITNLQRKEMVKSLEYTKLMKVKRSDFLELLSENSQDLEKFNLMKDSIIFDNNQEYMDVKCSVCSSCYHETQHCHYFHYSPDKYVIVQRNNFLHKEQLRDTKFERKEKYSSFKQFSHNRHITSSVLQLNFNFIIYRKFQNDLLLYFQYLLLINPILV